MSLWCGHPLRSWWRDRHALRLSCFFLGLRGWRFYRQIWAKLTKLDPLWLSQITLGKSQFLAIFWLFGIPVDISVQILLIRAIFDQNLTVFSWNAIIEIICNWYEGALSFGYITPFVGAISELRALLNCILQTQCPDRVSLKSSCILFLKKGWYDWRQSVCNGVNKAQSFFNKVSVSIWINHLFCVKFQLSLHKIRPLWI